jgi:hypothetical protein
MATSNIPILTGAKLFTDSANGSTAVAVVAASNVIYELELDNTANGAATFMRLYNTGSVTVGTTVPTSIIMVPASTKITMVLPSGVTFDTALTISSGTSATLATTTAPSSAFAVKIVYV